MELKVSEVGELSNNVSRLFSWAKEEFRNWAVQRDSVIPDMPQDREVTGSVLIGHGYVSVSEIEPTLKTIAGNELSIAPGCRLMHEGAQAMILAGRTADIIRTLSVPLPRGLSLPQIARTWFSHCQYPLAIARQSMLRLEHEGLVHLESVMLPPEPTLDAPLWEHTPESPNSPMWGRIAWKAQSRFAKPLSRTTVVTAGPKALLLMTGQRLRPVRKTELAHDVLGVAAIYLRLRESQPERAAKWIHEDAATARTRGPGTERKADALIEGQVPIFVEYAGSSYTAEHFKAFHEEFKSQHYQIW
jgi:hypothetical protein